MSEHYRLFKTQKNRVFQILQEEGLEPANFFWTSVESNNHSNVWIPRLNHRDTRFYFEFDVCRYPEFVLKPNEDNYCEFSPGGSVPIQRCYPGSWKEQLKCVMEWLINLKEEIEGPDLWAEMEKYKTSVSLTLPEQILNEPIPVYKAEEIANKLQKLADKIEEQFELTDEQNKFVRNKLNYLADAAKRQRSIDWVHTSIGVSVTIAMGLALAPEQAEKLWNLIKSIVGGFIHLIG